MPGLAPRHKIGNVTMRYTDKFKAIKSFVKLNIPHNKKNFTQNEKRLITKYYNFLESSGYLNENREGYIKKKVSGNYKIRNAPRLKNINVYVGTKIDDNGFITTDTNAKITIRKGQIYIKRGGLPYKWEFEYNIKKDWKIKPFVEHLKERMKPNKPKKGQVFVIGAGIYEMRGTSERELENLAKEILKLGNRYYADIREGKRSHKQAPELFMYRIIVYENTEAFKKRLADYSRKGKRKKKTKR